MPSICDHTSVGMFVWNNGKLLLIERAKPPYGFAMPAGHVDEDENFEIAAKRELKEEVGLDATKLTLMFEGRKDNPCRREGGTWHYWKMYNVEVQGSLLTSRDEVKRFGWYTKDHIKKLAERTEQFMEGKIILEEWIKDPGLEVVMLAWCKELGII